MKLLTLCIVLGLTALASADTYGKKGPRCFDCNYAPSGYVLTQANHVSKVGYQGCALRTEYDHNHVDKWGCKSGMCFIRKDYNGLVYRGCADEDNLPWGVDATQNCQYQGPNKSLYYFCEGDLCNKGQLGENQDLCGAPTSGQVGSSGNQATQPESAVVNEGYGKMAPTNFGYGINEPHPTENQVAAPEIQYGYDGLCDGQCYENPSGLFPFEADNNYFIQCESDFRDSQACVCCKPTVLRCPYGASFDAHTGVCSNMANVKYH